MARLILLIAALAIALILWHKITKARGDERKKLIFWSILGSLGAILLVLAVTGHLNLITAAIAGLIALLPRAMQLLKYLPFLSKIFQQHRQGSNSGQQQANHEQSAPRGKQRMSREQAMEVLNLKAGFTRQDVIQAHRRMMQKVHPDRGGSDYLAAQINQAKDTLIS